MQRFAIQFPGGRFWQPLHHAPAISNLVSRNLACYPGFQLCHTPVFRNTHLQIPQVALRLVQKDIPTGPQEPDGLIAWLAAGLSSSTFVPNHDLANSLNMPAICSTATAKHCQVGQLGFQLPVLLAQL